MMKFILFYLLIISNFSYSQIFLETFDEVNSSTTGVDNINGVSWLTTCPSCIDVNDWFYVQSGKLEGRDTNGPATFTTSVINTSSCSDLEITIDISESGTMGGCGTGCNSVDWVSLQYRIDGGAWIDPSNSYFCSGGCADINVIQSDDVIGTFSYTTTCFSSGNILELKVSVQTWASGEYWIIDNISVNCSSCSSLPIELISFEVENINGYNLLEWWSVSEVNNDYYILERSQDMFNWMIIDVIDGKGNHNSITNYKYNDYDYLNTVNYYRLSQIDFDGVSETFKSISINNNEKELNIIKIYNLYGQEVDMYYKGIKIILYDNYTIKKIQ